MKGEPKHWKGIYGSGGNVVSWTAMITRYFQDGKVDDALQLFGKMPIRNAVTWNAMVAGLSQNGRVEDARYLFDKMPERDVVSWNSMIAGYVQNRRIEEARQLFKRMPERNVVSWTAMLSGYAQNGFMENAYELFGKMPEHNVVSWNAMIAGYCRNWRVEEALQLFKLMPERNVVSWNAMITGFTQNERMEDARQLFDDMAKRNAVTWTVMITAYAHNGQSDEAVKLFSQMQWTNIKPNQSTYVGILNACANLADVEHGKQVHVQIIKSSLDSDAYVRSALVTMYAKCGNVINARKIFDRTVEFNVVLWNAIIAGYGHNGRVKDARQLFDKMPNRDVVSWSGMIAGYAQNGHPEEALKLFLGMQRSGVMPNQSTYVSHLNVCASIASENQGKQLHAHINKMGFMSDVSVGNALITLYAKCGSINTAQQLFSKMSVRDVVSWTAMIVGYAQNGNGKYALQLFEQMQLAHFKPNHVTFIGVLTACSHTGLVDEGWHYFDSMTSVHFITPRMDHYACMVDLLGRAGHLEEALTFIKEMPSEPDVVVLGSLLAACRIHFNLKLGKWAAKRIFELEPQTSATYVLLSNIYAAAGRWDDVTYVRKMMKERGVKKEPGWSWIEVKNNVHTFHVGDRSHPESEMIYAMLEDLNVLMKEAGYVPNTNFVLSDVL
eukprot:Gb_33439 [translate_table: standard]